MAALTVSPTGKTATHTGWLRRIPRLLATALHSPGPGSSSKHTPLALVNKCPRRPVALLHSKDRTHNRARRFWGAFLAIGRPDCQPFLCPSDKPAHFHPHRALASLAAAATAPPLVLRRLPLVALIRVDLLVSRQRVDLHDRQRYRPAARPSDVVAGRRGELPDAADRLQATATTIRSAA